MNNDARRLRGGLGGLASGLARSAVDPGHPDHYYVGQVHGLVTGAHAVGPVVVATRPVDLSGTAEEVGAAPAPDVESTTSVPVVLTRGAAQNGDLLIARLVDGYLAAENDETHSGPCGPCDLVDANGTLDETHGTTQTYQGILLSFDAVALDKSTFDCLGPTTITLPMRYRGFQRWDQFYYGNVFLTVMPLPGVWAPDSAAIWRPMFNQTFSIYCQGGRYWLKWFANNRAVNFTVGTYTTMEIVWALQDDSCSPALFSVDPTVPVQCSAGFVRVFHTNNTPIPTVQVTPIPCDHTPGYYVAARLAHSLSSCDLEYGGPAIWTPIYHIENIGVTGP